MTEFRRHKHDIELDDLWRVAPEVFRYLPFQSIVLTSSLQWLWKNINPNLTGKQWQKLLGNTLALTNGTGFPYHHDYINKEWVNKSDPKLDQVRMFGGTILKGDVVGGLFFFEAIDVRKPIPKAAVVLKSPWLYTVMQTVKADGNTIKFTQGKGYDCLAPMFYDSRKGLPCVPVMNTVAINPPPFPSPYYKA